MAKDKNFNISRNTEVERITARDVSIGDMFERQGSLHMRVAPAGPYTGSQAAETITICNMNTGAVWTVKDDEVYLVIRNCKISYGVWT